MDFWTFMDVYGYYLTIGMFVLSLVIQFWMKSVFSRYSKVPVRSGMSGKDAAELILRRYSLDSSFGGKGNPVSVEAVSGNLTDHYSPKEKIVRLSEATYGSRSVAAVGVAAHECGHAIQDAKSFFPNRIRAFLAPAASLGSRFGPLLAIIGLFMWNTSALGENLFMIGLAFFAIATLFYLVTLPVELDASRRAVAALRDERLLTEEEISGAKKVLTAAAMTYVAAAATSILQVLRLLAARNRRR